jgi:2-(1,2-epoxy-1,2-dihydrophenyl)acetyl-CoA isomerase
MSSETLLFERRDGVAYVTLNRPDRLNALDAPLIAELTAAAVAIEADSAVRAVLLRAAGRAFCAGADLMRGGIIEGGTVGGGTAVGGGAGGGGRAASPGEAVGASLRDQFNPMISAWCGLRVPVVVAVGGVAAGAGASLALVGDLVLAARSASFLQLFAPKLGLMPDLGSTFHLPRMIGTARAKGLALLGEELKAADAAAWGLIWACVEDTALDAEAETLVRRLAQGPTLAYSRIKATFGAELPETLEEQLALEARAQAALADSEDFAEGLAAFRGKRAPQFKGR